MSAGRMTRLVMAGAVVAAAGAAVARADIPIGLVDIQTGGLCDAAYQDQL